MKMVSLIACKGTHNSSKSVVFAADNISAGVSDGKVCLPEMGEKSILSRKLVEILVWVFAPSRISDGIFEG